MDIIKCKMCQTVYRFGHYSPCAICPVCVPKGVLILGDNKPIEAYMDGDSILGIDGITKVDHTFEHTYSGDLIHLKGVGMLETITTPEHPFLILSGNKQHHTIAWKEAKNIAPKTANDGDYLLIPRIQGQDNTKVLDLTKFSNKRGQAITKGRGHSSTLPLNEDTAWLLGLYVAEGCSAPKEFCFYLNKNETYLQRRIIDICATLGYKCYSSDKYTALKVACMSRIISRALKEWCGHKATEKKIPDWILFNKNINIVTSFFLGYINGDGCYTNNGIYKYIQSTTASPILSMQLQLLAIRLNMYGAIRRGFRGEDTILGRHITRRARYDISYYPLGAKHQLPFIRDDYIAVPIRRKTKTVYNGIVLDLKTLNHTFVVCNAITHNCGARDFNPKFGDKDDYYRSLRKTEGRNLQLEQMKLWKPRTVE
jgi:hypothetical protein